ncbi:hypothetical protein GCM10009530_36870 [Microbispora corallina]|uniref:HMA domain-containing protein n=1 Tax=Microbispora corallina TaxID=83302 RepID=A0ABQ4FY79_9ACTN|nr:hypothetical protein Mco01_27760 [Microbispora corallina]
MTIAAYTVTGMTCGHCVSSVKEDVGEVPGVTGVEVDLATGLVTVRSGEPVDPALIAAAVREAGYEVAGYEVAGYEVAGYETAGTGTAGTGTAGAP